GRGLVWRGVARRSVVETEACETWVIECQQAGNGFHNISAFVVGRSNHSDGWCEFREVQVFQMHAAEPLLVRCTLDYRRNQEKEIDEVRGQVVEKEEGVRE